MGNFKESKNKKYAFFFYTNLILFIIALFVSQISCTKIETEVTPPQAKIDNVKEIIHGEEVNDLYRWLENWDDSEVKTWSEGQNAYARSVLDNLPAVEELHKRIKEITSATSVSYSSLFWHKGALFAIKYQPPLNQPLLVTMPSAEEPESGRVIVDLNKLDATGSTSIDWYVPSPDGKLVAVSMSIGGSESGDLHIYETDSGKQVDIVIERVNGGTAGGDMAWLPDGSGFYYTRYPREGERPAEDLDFYQQLWFHKLGTPAESDRYIIGKDFPRIAEIKLEMNNRTGLLLVTVQYGDSGRFAHYIIELDGKKKQITNYDDKIVQAIFGPKGSLFLISRENAPRGKILKLALTGPPLEKAKTIIPEGDDSIVSSFYGKSLMVATETRLYLTYQIGGPSEIRTFDHNGALQPGPDNLPVSSVHEITPLDNDDILFRSSSYIVAPAWYRYKSDEAKTIRTALFSKSPVDFSDTEVAREYATSKDGTRIPVNIVRLKGTKLDGSNPVMLTGYGGFGASQSPGFSALLRVWIEQGGVFAIANIRGGGEFGEEWHRAGMLANKQNCFDDFAAAMQYMIDSEYTNPEKLAIMGGSNGGLLMGAMITQFPALCKATVSFVGIYDMLRNELTPNGAFNVPEYGTVKDKAQFRAMYAYSPYHNVKEETAYPSVLFMTGANDPRVDPMHSRKMTASLQAATTSEAPILLRTSSSTGHGIGTPLSEQINQGVDMYAFLFHELVIKYKPIK